MKHTLSLLLSAVALAAGTVTSAGCDMSHDMASMMTPESDVEFVDAMVPHHAMAVEMANEVLARGSDAQVRAMAQQMVDLQASEISTMKAARKALTGSDTVPKMHDAHMDADMEALKTLSGLALDRRFVDDMIPHHAGAIQMAHHALPYLQRTELRALAQDILRDQAVEIGTLQGHRTRLGS